ncbi:uncharacterized protein LOC126893603 [Daktulosphaira vitifoliae]|uniref:uncharacterized protein LOC126893603 n=1 Tax=Daktulosphaira vitifoliae TaxID=58002 RepID=UPI0021A99482|nr:uncharacterized protein LOC126893603 [Daktulosphaira vitifoliae]XP_050519929.1 uncharacterized protein LOC126893603 [Daktulosphaira vitifoliae]
MDIEYSSILKISRLLSNLSAHSIHEQVFGLSFMFTVETGFVPVTLKEHFNTIDSNIELEKLINSHALSSFWHEKQNIFTAQLLLTNNLCNLVGIPIDNSIIISLNNLNVSKSIVLPCSNNFSTDNLIWMKIKFKNLVSVPIKCHILNETIGQYPGLCGLPEELILYIMTRLDSKSLYSLMLSCKKLNDLAVKTQSLWKKLVYEEFKNSYHRGFHAINQHSINDWRLYYFKLKKEKCGRKTITIVREYT